MKVLLVGSGGREHALAKALTQDPSLSQLHCAPGNPGIAQLATLHPLDIENPNSVAALAIALDVDLVVIGPETPLVNGAADAIRKAGIACFGPSKAAAQLEGSKDFAKSVMRDAGVPTAKFATCENQSEIERALDLFGAPYVVKHDGLAAGKGVVVTSDRVAALHHALKSSRVVIEEFLDGPEVSLFGISDGETVIPLQPAQDFKRVFDNDEGPNTGGMGAYSPLPWAPDDIMEDTLKQVLNPTIQEMAARGTPFIGLLYAGLSLTTHGIKVIEFNARFGDPETQVILPRLKTPLVQLLFAAATGALNNFGALEWRDESAVSVVLASKGYPETPIVGDEITGIEERSDTEVFHAGTKVVDGKLRASGGRVLSVTGLGLDLTEARNRAYQSISQITLSGSFYRSDIALNASMAEKGN